MGKKKACRNNRQGETQAARNERKWLSRVVEVEKLLKESSWDSWQYRRWRDPCNGSSLDPRMYNVKFLKQFTDDLQRMSYLGSLYRL